MLVFSKEMNSLNWIAHFFQKKKAKANWVFIEPFWSTKCLNISTELHRGKGCKYNFTFCTTAVSSYFYLFSPKSHICQKGCLMSSILKPLVYFKLVFLVADAIIHSADHDMHCLWSESNFWPLKHVIPRLSPPGLLSSLLKGRPNLWTTWSLI